MDSEVQVFDDVVDGFYNASLVNIVSGEDFTWQLIRDIASNGNPQDDITQYAFRHLMWWQDEKVSDLASWFQPLVNFCAESAGGVLVGIPKVWMNMNMNYGLQNGNLCHCDGFMHLETETLKRYTGIYYLNDSDGDTLFYADDGQTVVGSVSPKANRAVVFPSRLLHSRQLPIKNNRRLVLNINVLVDIS